MTLEKKIEPEKLNKVSKPPTKPVINSIKMQVFGDMIKLTKKSNIEGIAFRKFDVLATSWVALPKPERLLLYRFLCGVVITAHAKRTENLSQRTSLYALKNKLYLSIANDFESRKVLNFRLLVSPRFRVLEYCNKCVEENTLKNVPKRRWSFCEKCTVDKDYYNILSMFHKFKFGGASLFLGNELMNHVKGLKVLKRAKFSEIGEEIRFQKYAFNSASCISIDIDSAVDAAYKILDIFEKTKKQENLSGFSVPLKNPTSFKVNKGVNSSM
jgi:hypothetical protein